MKDKKEIKKDILDKFRSIREASEYVLSPRWVESHYLDALTPTERKLFEKAIKELISQGLVEAVDEIPYHLRLTEKGENLIY